MMKTISYVLMSALLLCTVSCKKKVATVNSDYVGTWMGYDAYKSYSLVIGSDSKGVYEASGSATFTVRGTVRIKGSTMKIVTKKLTIDQEPTQDPSNPWHYTMKLNGVTYDRN